MFFQHKGCNLTGEKMEELIIEATKSFPFVHLDPTENTLEIRGESYPENAAKMYAPVFAWIEEYLKGLQHEVVRIDFEITYFNSSSSKILMNFFDMLEDAAENGKKIVVNWYYHEDNETALECGEEFQEDMELVEFNLREISDTDD